jgi:four helix bundle protein
VVRGVWRRVGVTEADAWEGMNTTLRQQLLEQIVTLIGQARPLLEAIGRKDRELESQLRRSLGSIALNVAEGFGVQAGNARLRFRSALGSLYESQAAVQVAAAWGYVDERTASRIVADLEAFGGRLYGLSRR